MSDPDYMNEPDGTRQEKADRKDEILASSLDALRKTRKRRTAARQVTRVGLLVAAILVPVAVLYYMSSWKPSEVAQTPESAPQTERTLVEFELLSDQQLLNSLSEAGQPCVLATVGNDVVLVPQRK